MSLLWSEENKVVQVLTLAEQTDADHTTDIVNVADYKRLTFLIVTGASAANIPQVTVLAGISNASAATAIIFKYRTQIGAVPPAANSDVPSELTAAETTGFAVTTAKEGGVYIIEVDIREVAEGGVQYDHVCLKLTQDGSTHAVHNYTVLAILSQPRYPQGILQTAID